MILKTTRPINLPHWQWLDEGKDWVLIEVLDHPEGWHDHSHHERGAPLPADSVLMEGHDLTIQGVEGKEAKAHHEKRRKATHERLTKLHAAAVVGTSAEALASLHGYFDSRYKEHSGRFRVPAPGASSSPPE